MGRLNNTYGAVIVVLLLLIIMLIIGRIVNYAKVNEICARSGMKVMVIDFNKLGCDRESAKKN